MGHWKNSVPRGCSTEIPSLSVVIGWRPLSLPQFYSQSLIPCIVIHHVVFPFSRSAGEPLSFWISLFRNGSDIILRVHLIRSDLRTITFSMNSESTGQSPKSHPFLSPLYTQWERVIQGIIIPSMNNGSYLKILPITVLPLVPKDSCPFQTFAPFLGAIFPGISSYYRTC